MYTRVYLTLLFQHRLVWIVLFTATTWIYDDARADLHDIIHIHIHIHEMIYHLYRGITVSRGASR